MSLEVRTIKRDEAAAWLRQRGVGFLHVEPEGTDEHFLTIADLDRSRGAFDGDAIVGTLRSFASEFTVPGPAAVAASALTNVTVAPTHRRRGVLTEMITADLRESAERGEAVSILIASEYPIYGRFGYGAAIEGATYTIDTVGLRFVRPSEGTVELVDLRTLRELAPPVYERFRAAQPGSIERSPAYWDRTLRQIEVPGDEPRKGFQAVYRSPSGDVEGYVLYDAKNEWDVMRPKGTLAIEELMSVTPDAYQALWEYCVGVDLLTTVSAPKRCTDEVLPWLVDDARRVKLTGRHDFVWVRVLDTCAALASRHYLVEGRLVIEVRDELGLAGGRFALEANPEGSSCTSTSEPPDVSVPVQALGSALMGGVSWGLLDDAGLVDEHRPGAAALADRMFLTSRTPWCTTWF